MQAAKGSQNQNEGAKIRKWCILERGIKGKRHKTEAMCLELCPAQRVNLNDWRSRHVERLEIQGGSNMTGTDLCVNKPHCAAAVRP